jgi:hypothetical protein
MSQCDSYIDWCVQYCCSLHSETGSLPAAIGVCIIYIKRSFLEFSAALSESPFIKQFSIYISVSAIRSKS